MLFLTNDDVARVIDMPLCLDSLEGLFRELARGDAEVDNLLAELRAGRRLP